MHQCIQDLRHTVVIGLLPKHLQPIQQTPPLHSGCPWRFTRECKFGKVDSVNWVKCPETSPLRLKKLSVNILFSKYDSRNTLFFPKETTQNPPQLIQKCTRDPTKKTVCPPGFHLLVVSAWAADGPTPDRKWRCTKGFLEILFQKTCWSCYVEFL